MPRLENDLSALGTAAQAYLDRSHPMHIGGKAHAAAASYDLSDPTTGQSFARAADASAADVDAAVRAARAALNGAWGRMRPNERELAMLRLADLLERHETEIAEIETLCSGRLLANTRGVDVGYSAHFLRYMAGWATKLEGQTARLSIPYIPDGEMAGFTFREPIGVVGAIVPWNVALGIAVWKIAPALAAGCTIVLKPAPQTPLSALRFAELALEAGIPEGVINIVTGSGAETGIALVRHPDVNMVTFTGSTPVGRQIAVDAAGAFKRCSLELGGKSPVILFQDAPLERAIPAAAWAIFSNHGQNCCAGSRLYVHRSLYDQVIEGVAEIARNIVIGSPLDPATQMGPVVTRAQQRRIHDLINAGTAEGARVVVGGTPIEGPGSYVPPTVLTDVRSDMTPVREEIFGPVLVAASFDSDAEALALANGSEFGLGASIWTNDLGRVHHMTRKLEAGSIWVNVHNALDVALPFGGWKNSGMGADLSEAAVLAHTKIKASVHHYAELP
ncbi:Phenylacetaldehyde dehydrogenase [Devosia equisanguinis]|uniref:Phenylacetaldehyde dehydrogenase n=1 Tax=Devosia equisanguinis TaxID=2490941 RepID=A0A447IDY6_9HYPH|nr:aldehyde dehydrogenase family protein [Devosia equisanguinis]VDS05697.1 Phenylacetaldehyde dehydrogenase [Devosia equisanguinis]